MIRAVAFDLDRTLLDRDRSFLHFVQSQYDRFSEGLAAIPRPTFVRRVIALDQRGKVWKDKVYQALLEEFPSCGMSWRDLFDDFDARVADYYFPFAGLREMLDTLTASGYPLGLISNGRHEFQMRTIRRLELERDFQAILISESEGVRKPDAEIFRRALAKLDCEPHEGVFVGDDPDADIRGAHRLGMKTIWKRNLDFSRASEADAVVDDLEDIPMVIASFG